MVIHDHSSLSWFMLCLCDNFVEGKGIGYGGSVSFGYHGTQVEADRWLGDASKPVKLTEDLTKLGTDHITE